MSPFYRTIDILAIEGFTPFKLIESGQFTKTGSLPLFQFMIENLYLYKLLNPKNA